MATEANGPGVEILTTPVSYKDAGITLTGLIFRNGAPGPRRGLLVIHGGAGLDDHARGQAQRYAELGYVVLAGDMFGPGVAGDRQRVVALVTALRDDPARLARRTRATVTALAAHPDVDGPIAVIGFCFGGMAALALARAGEPLAAAVSIHGSLATSQPARPGVVQARVLVCHGALDPHVPLADVTAFAQEMDQAGADWQLSMHGGASHGFTHVGAVAGAVPGVAYHASADRRSFALTRDFLADAFGAGSGPV
jgi:dienelactone hydrolase